MFGRTLKKHFTFSAVTFYKSTVPADIKSAAFGTVFLRFAADKYAHFVACGNTYAPLPPPPTSRTPPHTHII